MLQEEINNNRNNINNLKNQAKKFHYEHEKVLKCTDEYTHKKAN